MALLTKSKYMIGLQCPQYLWVIFNAKELIPEVDAATQFMFDQGHEVGVIAKQWFSNGIDISAEDFKGNLKKTKALLNKRVPLFEAGFMENNLFSRIDILNPIGDNEWDIIEVKSSTEVKEEHYHDVSFQKLCCERAGLRIRRCFLMHINNEYIKQGEIDPKGLLMQEDITEEVKKASHSIGERIEKMFKIINMKKMPKVSIAKGCDKPYKCPLKQDCWKFLPNSNVFQLYRGKDKAFKLFEEGIVELEKIPNDIKLTEKQELQKECALNGRVHIHKEGIKHFLMGLKYPLYFLDFETCQFAIPRFDNSRPWQQIPFQFSLHIVQDNGDLEHHEFLASGADDPRQGFIKELKNVIGSKGAVVVYNQSFEISRLRELAELFPSEKNWIEDVISRVVDLIVPFRNFSYYNPLQHGSASIKNVLPAMTGKGYSELEINNGGDASLAYVDMYFTGTMDSKQIAKKREALLKYCCLDTEGMIWIVDKLKEIVK